MRTPSDDISSVVESMERRPDGMYVKVRVMGLNFLPGAFGDALAEVRARSRAVAATGPGQAVEETIVRSIAERRAHNLTTILSTEDDEVTDTATDRIYEIHVTR
jgi:hypothetical protein